MMRMFQNQVSPVICNPYEIKMLDSHFNLMLMDILNPEPAA